MRDHVLQVQEPGPAEEEGKFCRQDLWGKGGLALSP